MQTCFGRRGGFAPISLPLFQGWRREAVEIEAPSPLCHLAHDRPPPTPQRSAEGRDCFQYSPEKYQRAKPI